MAGAAAEATRRGYHVLTMTEPVVGADLFALPRVVLFGRIFLRPVWRIVRMRAERRLLVRDRALPASDDQGLD